MSGDLGFDAFEFFKEEIKNENASIKIGAVCQVKLIASAMGQKNTINQLIPELSKVVKEEPLCNDEEFLFQIAKQYAELKDFVADSDIDQLIAPLEHLATQEETVIRDQAIKSLCELTDKKPGLAEKIVETFQRLAQKQDFFTARVSACALLPTTYTHANEQQRVLLRKKYTELCADDTPMVRRAAAHKLKDFMKECAKQDILTDMIQVYTELSQEDTQDTIRVACVLTTLEIARKFDDNENRQHTIQVVREASIDRSWRVRLTVAKNFNAFCEAFGPELTNECLMEPFKQLLKDNEQEVRKETILVLDQDWKKFPTVAQATELLPYLKEMGLDPAQTVRAALAKILSKAAIKVDSATAEKELLPIISDLMKDEFHDVRLNIVSDCGKLCQDVPKEFFMSNILGIIQNLIMDNHWRIRQSVVEQLPALAKKLGKDIFENKLEVLLTSSLKDSVHAVREAAIKMIEEIGETFGAQWMGEHLLPKLVETYSQTAGYANRLTTLQVLPRAAKVLAIGVVELNILPLLLKATKDTVPNVRFCACQQLVQVLGMHDFKGSAMTDSIKGALTELEADSDIDVQYYAQAALGELKKRSV